MHKTFDLDIILPEYIILYLDIIVNHDIILYLNIFLDQDIILDLNIILNFPIYHTVQFLWLPMATVEDLSTLCESHR